MMCVICGIRQDDWVMSDREYHMHPKYLSSDITNSRKQKSDE